jgi:hypothetical protein
MKHDVANNLPKNHNIYMPFSGHFFIIRSGSMTINGQ